MTPTVTLRLAGDTRTSPGLFRAGRRIAETLAAAGQEVCTFRSGPETAEGGPAWIQIRAGAGPILSPGDGPDLLAAFDKESAARHRSALGNNGLLAYDLSAFGLDGDVRARQLAMPLGELSAAAGSGPFREEAAAGALLQLLGLPPEGSETTGPESQARAAGARWAREHPAPGFLVKTRVPSVRTFMEGGEALAAGALAAGCTFLSVGPLSAGFQAAAILAEELPKRGGAVAAAADEAAALRSCLEAAERGARALTIVPPSSLSALEPLGRDAVSAGRPVVILVAGPEESTALERVLLACRAGAAAGAAAASGVDDARAGLARAFEAAETRRGPVIFLADSCLDRLGRALLPAEDFASGGAPAAARRYGDERTRIGILSWGSAGGPAEEAVQRARALGYEAGALHLRILHPLPRVELEAFLGSVRDVVAAEPDPGLPLARLLRETYLRASSSLSRSEGTILTPGEVFSRFEEVLRDS